MSNEENSSVSTVLVLLMIAIALLGWAFFAAAYAHAEQDWGSGAGGRALRAFFANAIQQVPNMGAVLSFVFTKRLWLVGIVAGLEVLALLGMEDAVARAGDGDSASSPSLARAFRTSHHGTVDRIDHAPGAAHA